MGLHDGEKREMLMKTRRNHKNSGPGESKKVRKSRALSRGLVETVLSSGESALKTAERFQVTLDRVKALRRVVERLRPELEWLQAQEPAILDSLRADALHHFTQDPDRKWTILEYAILVDKSRLLRNESTINLAGLVGLVNQAEQREVERFKALATGAPGAPGGSGAGSAAGPQGGDPTPTAPPPTD